MQSQAYRYLSAVLAAGSISKAAQALGISQPSLSQFVQRIEKDLGAEVFDRSTRPLTLTESGRIFFEAEKRVAEIREDCRRAVQDINGGERGRVVVGASEYREMFFLTEVLPVFSAAHPGIEIALEEGTTRELEDFVWTGKTDLSLVIAPLAQSGLEAVEIYEERLLLAVNEKSPLIEKARALCPEERREDEFPPFSFRLLADEPFLVVREGQQIHDLYRTLVAETGAPPKIVLESESLTAALALAGAGLGVTIVTETLARRSAAAKRVRFFSIDPEVPVRKVVAAYRPARYLSKAARLLIRTMRDVAQENSPAGEAQSFSPSRSLPERKTGARKFGRPHCLMFSSEGVRQTPQSK